MAASDAKSKLAVQARLHGFKDQGIVQFDRVLSIPSGERIQALIKEEEGYMNVAAALTASIKSAMENINLKLPLSENQLVELAGLIIEESAEDNLALEDVLLFLQQLVNGKAGKIYDRMDIPRFFEMFEAYRQERHLMHKRIQEEKHANFKALGDNERWSENTENEKKEMHNAMNDYLKNTYQNPEPK